MHLSSNPVDSKLRILASRLIAKRYNWKAKIPRGDGLVPRGRDPAQAEARVPAKVADLFAALEKPDVLFADVGCVKEGSGMLILQKK